MARRPNERWAQFAERVANAFGLVLLLVLATYVLYSLLPYKGWTAVLTTAVATSAAIVGLASAGVRGTVFRIAVLLGGAAFVLAVLSEIVDDLHLLGASAFVQTVLLLFAAGAVLRPVVTATEVGFRTILGAISVYMIFGLLFTFLYAALDRVENGNFFGVHVHGGDIVFFSFTTLTTTGYGNLVPAGQPGRMFSGLEMLMGQIFLVTLVAGLVSLWRPGTLVRRRRGEG
jgi:ion channel